MISLNGDAKEEALAILELRRLCEKISKGIVLSCGNTDQLSRILNLYPQ